MLDMNIGRFDVRSMSRREMERQAFVTRNMFVATIAASLSIVGAGAFFVSLWL